MADGPDVSGSPKLWTGDDGMRTTAEKVSFIAIIFFYGVGALCIVIGMLARYLFMGMIDKIISLVMKPAMSKLEREIQQELQKEAA